MVEAIKTKIDLSAIDVPDIRLEELLRLFPEATIEGKIDFTKLRQSLGDVINSNKEKYGLSWAGKSEAIQVLQTSAMGTLVPIPEQSINFESSENLIIEGDNLEVLKLLQKSYYSKVKMIYIDPPYNTGNEFIYPDNFKEGLEDYLKYSGQTSEDGLKLSTSTEGSGRYHSKWLSMMYPRLFLAKNLLRQDGVIFVSIDDREVHNLRCLMNEIFGEENFVATIPIINNLKGRNDKKNVATCHDYLLVFAKSEFESYGLPLNDEQLKQYKYKDDKGEKYALRDLRKRGRPDRREDRPKMYFPLYYSESTKNLSLVRKNDSDIEIVPTRGDGSDGRWRWGKERVEKNLNILHAKYSESKNRWDIEHRVYLNASYVLDAAVDDDQEEADDDDMLFERTSKSKSFWWGGEISTDVGRREFKKVIEDIDFDYPKSPFFIERLLHMATKDDDIILDFFAGSGTTGQAVLALNKEKQTSRRFILVQLPEKIETEVGGNKYKSILDVCSTRIRNVIKQLSDDRPFGGFKAFKLSSSNFKEWRQEDGSTGDETFAQQLRLHIENVKEKRGSLDIVYEVALKLGYELSVAIETVTLAKQPVYFIAGGEFLLCVEKKITSETLHEMMERKPKRIVCLDVAFEGNDMLKTNIVLEMQSHSIAFHTV